MKKRSKNKNYNYLAIDFIMIGGAIITAALFAGYYFGHFWH